MYSGLMLPEKKESEFPHANEAYLISKLHDLEKKQEKLQLLNDLYARLTKAIDVSGIIEAFSVWLMPHVPHEVIAYKNHRNGKVYVYSSGHGPKRRRALETVNTLIQTPDQEQWRGQYEHYYIHNYILAEHGNTATLLVLQDSGAHDMLTGWLMDDALAIMGDSLNRASGHEDLFVQARQDSLTGLANRRVFEERIGYMIEGAARHNRPITIACMDLDKFKSINDTYGHSKGDKVLQKVAGAISKILRKSDLLVRMGGDEFILVMPETDLANAEFVAQRICKTVTDLAIALPGGEKLGISIGIAQWHKKSKVEGWLKKADNALYRAKESGRSTVCRA